MELYGSNAGFGTTCFNLTETRTVMPLDQESPQFPMGTGGLLPVETVRKKGALKTVYAFCCPEELYETEGTDDKTIQALVGAVELINSMLEQAASLSGHPFGDVGGVQVGITEEGWGFTHVETLPPNAQTKTDLAVLRLIVETNDEPTSPGSLEAIIDLDAEGNVLHVAMAEYDEDYSCKVSTFIDEDTDELEIQKVEEFEGRYHKSHLLYKKGLELTEGHKSRGNAQGKPQGDSRGKGSSQGKGPGKSQKPRPSSWDRDRDRDEREFRGSAGNYRSGGDRFGGDRFGDDRRPGRGSRAERGGWDY